MSDRRWGFAFTTKAQAQPVEPIFPSEMRSPLRDPLLYRWEGIDKLRPILPWCRVETARFMFAVEGIGILVIRGELSIPLTEVPVAVDQWEAQPDAYVKLDELARTAKAAFDDLARRSELKPDLRRGEGSLIPWLYTITYSADQTPYPLPSRGSSRFRDSHVEVAWRGAHVRSSNPAHAPDRDLIDALFTACCLSWESLRVLDRLLASNLEQHVLRPHGEDDLRYQEAQQVRDVQFFGRYLLGISDPLRWTLREAPLEAIQMIMAAWRIDQLRTSVEIQANLVALQSQQIEQRQRERHASQEETHRKKIERLEKEEADRAKRQAEQLDFNIKLVGLLLAAASIYSAVANLVNLYLRIEPDEAAWWEYGLPAVPLAIALAIVLPIAKWLHRQRQARDQPAEARK